MVDGNLIQEGRISFEQLASSDVSISALTQPDISPESLSL